MGPDRLRARLVLGPDGIMRSARAEGHAGTARAGENIACAAVSVLMRTAYETAASYGGVDIRGSAPEPGAMSFEIRRCDAEAAERLRGVGDFLAIGLSSVEREYPGVIDLTIESERRS